MQYKTRVIIFNQLTHTIIMTKVHRPLMISRLKPCCDMGIDSSLSPYYIHSQKQSAH